MSISPTRVLVVGGHPVILGVVRLACDALPNVQIVAEAGDGPTAVAAATSFTPELAVIDLDLPGTDGVDVLRSLRDQGFRGLVVVVSERADGATVLSAMRLGVDAYLIKPDGLRRIGDAIRRVLDGERVDRSGARASSRPRARTVRSAGERELGDRRVVDVPRAGDPGAPRRGPHDATDRPAARHLTPHRRDPRGEPLPEARRSKPGPGGLAGGVPRADRAPIAELRRPR